MNYLNMALLGLGRDRAHGGDVRGRRSLPAHTRAANKLGALRQ